MKRVILSIHYHLAAGRAPLGNAFFFLDGCSIHKKNIPYHLINVKAYTLWNKTSYFSLFVYAQFIL
jgi:hypothetical protein